MTDDRSGRDKPHIPLSWLVSPNSDDGAAGRPFPTMPPTPQKPGEPPHVPATPGTLPHAGPKLAELPRAEPAPETPAKGFKGGEDEC